MKSVFRKIYMILLLMGIDPIKTIHFFKGMPYFIRDLNKIKTQRISTIKEFPFGKYYPCLNERFTDSGSTKGHYFHQDLLVARRIYLNNPSIHIDIGSRMDGFVAHVASFRSIEVIDIRPLSSSVPNIIFKQADMMAPLMNSLVGYSDSLSCLHALEHFGLGRYGDTVNYDGYILGLNNLYRILKRKGKLYLSVPIGLQRIEFNAHRVFSVKYLLECFDGKYEIDQFSFVDDKGELHENVSLNEVDINNNFGCNYGCGIFEMTKL